MRLCWRCLILLRQVNGSCGKEQSTLSGCAGRDDLSRKTASIPNLASSQTLLQAFSWPASANFHHELYCFIIISLGSSTCSKLIPDYLNASRCRQRAISTAVLLLLLPGLELMQLRCSTVKILTFQLIKPNSMKATTPNFKKSINDS